jgi:hypothetical protein
MDEEKELVNAVLKRLQDVDGARKLSCAEAFELAQEFQVKVGLIGRICNQQNIKICKCQLGCFR